MSDYSDRLDRIRESRNKTIEYNKKHDIPVDCLPRMHLDLYWLLDIVDSYNEFVQENEHIEAAARIKMEHIMDRER